MNSTKINIFIIYAREDVDALRELRAQLAPVTEKEGFQVWYDGEILPGQDWDKVIKANLKKSDIILLFISKHFFNSEYIQKTELREALIRHKEGKSVVIPVIIRPCVWEDILEISNSQALPENAHPVFSKYWHDPDEALVTVVEGIRRTSRNIRAGWQEADRKREIGKELAPDKPEKQINQQKNSEIKETDRKEKQRPKTLVTDNTERENTSTVIASEPKINPNRVTTWLNRLPASSLRKAILIFAGFALLAIAVIFGYQKSSRYYYLSLEEKTLAMASKKYDSVSKFVEGRLIVEKDGLYGFLDQSGNEIVPPQYDEVKDFKESMALVYKRDLWGYIDLKGKEIISPQFNNAFSFNHGLARVEKEKNWNFIRKDGSKLTEMQFDHAWDFEDGFAPVEKNGKWTFINEFGQEMNKMAYDEARPVKEGFSAVQAGSKWSFVNNQGQLLDSLRYEKVSDFTAGFAAVTNGGKTGMIDKTGAIRIPLQYDKISKWNVRYAVIQEKYKYGVIDPDGQIVIKPQFDDLVWLFENCLAVKKDGKWGFSSLTGTSIEPCQYDSTGNNSVRPPTSACQ